MTTAVLKAAVVGICMASVVGTRGAHAATPISDADSWPAYARSYDSQHFSPLSDINSNNVSRLGLQWHFDIPGVVLSASTPIQVGGTLYFASGYSVIRALDAKSGRLLWMYDPKVPEVAGEKLRKGWGIRGIAYW